MAIKIPSKNIYDINNSKVVDNVKKTVSVQEIIPQTIYDDFSTSVTVWMEQAYSIILKDYIGFISKDLYAQSNENVSFSLTNGKLYCTIKINKDNYISSKYPFKIRLGGQYRTGQQNFASSSRVELISNDFLSEIKDIKFVPSELEIKLQDSWAEQNIGAQIEYITSDAIIAQNIQSIGKIRLKAREESGVEQKNYYMTIQLEPIYTSLPNNLRAVFESYTINISAPTYDFGTTQSLTIGSGNKPFELSSNELTQEGNKYGETSLSEYVANSIIKNYSNGKETATLLCSISDYYDYDTNEKVIDITSSDKMSFKLHDQVIPMVYGADGKDRPMSLYRDGTPKVFQVLGSKIFYDGAVWQELSLQEVAKG